MTTQDAVKILRGRLEFCRIFEDPTRPTVGWIQAVRIALENLEKQVEAVEPNPPPVDPAAVRCAVEWDASTCSLGRHISRSLNLPEIRAIAMDMTRWELLPQMVEKGTRILQLLDGTEGGR